MRVPSLRPPLDIRNLPEVLWVEDLAAILGLGLVQVRRKIRKGEIPAKRVGKRWYVLREQLIATLRP